MTWFKVQIMSSKVIAVVLTIVIVLTYFPVFAYASEDSTTFTFSDESIAVEGSSKGYKIEGTNLTINEAGTYILTGSCSDGSVTVKKDTTGVILALDGLTLTAADTAPISCNKNTEVTIQVGKSNTLTDGENPADEDSTDEAVADAFEGAAIKVKSGASLTVNGTGILNIEASSCKNGIKGASSSMITVESSTLNINAANSALACDHQLFITGGTLNILSQDDGLKADPDEDDSDSQGSINITGGTFKIEAAGDAINGSGDVNILGGTFIIDSGDDAVHSDAVLSIGIKDSAEGPDIKVNRCVEGFEGATVNLYSGSGTIVSSDDGINAANSDLMNYDFAIHIYGGSWYVDAGGDGLDSNGTVTVSGGTTEVYGAEKGSEGNTALDCDKGITVTGGTIFTVDSAGITPAGTYVLFGSGDNMMKGSVYTTTLPESDNRDFRYRWNHGIQMITATAENIGAFADTSSVTKGSELVVKDSSGNTVYSAVSARNASCVMLSSDALIAGESYTLYINGTKTVESSAVTAETSSGMTMGDGRGDAKQGGFQNKQQSGQWNGLQNGQNHFVFEPVQLITRAIMRTLPL